MTCVLGLFVGGRSSRMGRPKGSLHTGEGETLIDRALRVGREAGLDPVLVGDASPYPRVGSGVERLADDPAGVGPLGGIRALLRSRGTSIVLACDMPYVDGGLLRALRDAPPAAVVAPRRERWEPLCARYDPRVLPTIDRALAAGRHSLQALLDRVEVLEIAVQPEVLRDWDRPSDVDAGG